MTTFSPGKREALFLAVLTAIQFTYVLDFMIMSPLGPQLMRDLHIDASQFGLLLSSYSVAAAISSVAAALYIDRYDRRPQMLWLYGMFALATLACGLTSSFLGLLAARILAGIFGGVVAALVQIMVADAIPFERRGKAMGTVMMAFSLATVSGVPLGLLLAQHLPSLSWRAPFLLIALMAGLNFLLAWCWLPSMRSHLARAGQVHAGRQVLAAATAPTHLCAFAFLAAIVLSGFTMFPYVALYLTRNVGLPESAIALIYLSGGIASFFGSRLIGVLADRHGKQAVFTWVALASFIPLLAITHMGQAPEWLALLTMTAFFVLVPGRMVPGMAMVGSVPPAHLRGSFMSLAAALQMMMVGVATMLGGLIIRIEPDGRLQHYVLTGYLGVICGCLAIWLMWRMKPAPLSTS